MKKGATVHDLKSAEASFGRNPDRTEPSLPPDPDDRAGAWTGRGARRGPEEGEPVPVEPVDMGFDPEPIDVIDASVVAERDASGRDAPAREEAAPRGSSDDGGGREARRAAEEPPDLHLPVDPRQITPRIGEILVAAGKMAGDQIETVLEQQERTPDRRFGEIVVARRLATQKDVDVALASQFGYSSGGVGGEVDVPEEIVVAHTPYSPFAEALRSLRSQLMLRWFDGTPQQGALAITSVDRGDGKSFICANLGVVFSQLGERTLIIDADLRNSTQHKKFGLPNKMGLSGMLSGRAGVEEILGVKGLSNLAILPAGPLPPNPQELLGRETFGRLLAGLSKSFDVILIDTPSAQQASDAQVVAQRARAALIVGRKDKTKSNEISQLAAVMAGSGIKILGAALNDY